MKTIEVVGHVDESHRLHADVPPTVAPGPVKLLVLVAEESDFEWPAPDVTEDDWRRFVAHGLAMSWPIRGRTFTLFRTESRLMKRSEIWLARFPYGGTAGSKIRPVLLLVPELLTAYVTSVIPTSLLPSDLVLDPATAEHQTTNLKTRSVLRLHKLASVHARDAVRQLGTLSSAAMDEVENRLRALLAL